MSGKHPLSSTKLTNPKPTAANANGKSTEITSPKKKPTYESLLTQLKAYTTIVADTSEFDLIAQYHPEDATTNPSLIYQAIQKPEYSPVLDKVITKAYKQYYEAHPNKKATTEPETECIEYIYDSIVVYFGHEILKYVPGKVSTEVDARYSFDMKKTIARAKQIIELYKKEYGIGKEKVLIKIASTWEGIQAGRELEKEGIHCNMTLIFALPQAIAAAEAHATLISPFVGRILDWYKANDVAYAKTEYIASKDPGVISVREIYGYYKKYGYKTIVMGASFRNIEETLALSGCDRLTIAPKLLEELSTKKDMRLERHLEPKKAAAECHLPKVNYTESEWRYAMNESRMGTEKLSEGIRNFAKDGNQLAMMIKEKLAAKNKEQKN